MSDKLTSCVKEEDFNNVAQFINTHFELGLTLDGNWFDNNIELKAALRANVPADVDDLKINVAVWNLVEMLKAESDIKDGIVKKEISAQKVEPLDLTVQQYKAALNSADVLNDESLSVLKGLYQLPEAKATSSQLAKALSLKSHAAVNGIIGRLSKRIARFFDIEKDDIRNRFTGWWQLVADGEEHQNGFTWQMKPNLMIALEELNLVAKTNDLAVREKKVVPYSPQPLNQIFYGPPGTGKTYYSIEAAVRAAEPAFKWESRAELKDKYDQLVAQKRIQFVTFHQSYGYEEFIEGLKAVSEDGNISYEVQSGVFKRICTSAANNLAKSFQSGRVGFEASWEIFLDTFDDDQGVTIPTKKSSFRITEVTDTTIHFEKAQGSSKHTLAIKTLREVFNGTKVIKGGLNVYYLPLVEHLKTLVSNVPAYQPAQNYVLIIDEINRGNISKIFGELITLIEESKRSFGASNEAIEVSLTYSGDPFTVPNNLYLIGTMNTADRSLAMMDTALRRRFEFIEMMPDYNTLTDLYVKGISLKRLLETINMRIEALYDREHTLGHAFFIPVSEALKDKGEEAAFKNLQEVVQKRVLPLLEEYFFEDWNKIRLVLGDNQKQDELQFITETSYKYDELFGANHGLDNYVTETKSFAISPSTSNVWDNPATYIHIYSAQSEL
ncbi:AAA domain-containing protein [Alteromonas sp. MYP5]|uniref:AAA domain-containing protein n=2 Tax=Alteromonas ponticola TaxID=2720613 RepID=A0ABX1R4M5_9ALTE|nr:AAA domain-containing protein [Alteromonas ponticola]